MREKPILDLSRCLISPIELHQKDLHIRGWETKINRKTFLESDTRIVFEKISETIIGTNNVVKFFIKNFSFANYEHAKHASRYCRKIPKEVRDTHIFFAGTIWRSGSGLYFIPALRNNKTSEWELDFYNISNGIPIGSYVAIAIPIQLIGDDDG